MRLKEVRIPAQDSYLIKKRKSSCLAKSDLV